VEAQEALLRPRESKQERVVERARGGPGDKGAAAAAERCPGCGGAKKPASGGGAACATCGKGGASGAPGATVQGRAASGAAVQMHRAPGAPVQGMDLGDVIPDGIMSQLRSLSGSASSYVSGLGSRADGAVAEGEAEGAGVPAEAQGRVDEGVG
jgi:hypothetical protein